MKLIIILSFILAVALANSEWESFKVKYGRKYGSPTEEFYRKKIFLDNKMTIDKHNQRFEEGKTTFTMGINQFADMTNQEYNEILKTFIKKEQDESHAQEFSAQINSATVDWRDSGCVTGVKDQGQCGSGYAFACTGTTEFVDCRASGKLVSCSEQNLMDCSWSIGSLQCCDGGIIDDGLEYIVENGIYTSADYPYTVKCNPDSCIYSPPPGCYLYGYRDVTPSGNESALETAVASVGPVAAAIDASRVSFQLYSSGVYDEPLCSSTQMDHGVLIVGYGVDGRVPYWLVKNSWGIAWGIQGYIEMSKDQDNQCGIASQASYGI